MSEAGRAAEAVREQYRAAFGSVPQAIERRLAVARASDRIRSVQAIEQLRATLLHENPLGGRVQQLVHFGQLLALGRADAARLHAAAALRAGAGLPDLVGVAETALVTAGMPAYALGIDIAYELTEQRP